MKYNKQAIELNSLLKKNMPKMDMSELISSDCWFEFELNLE